MNEAKRMVFTDKLQNKAYILDLDKSQIKLLNFLFNEDILSNNYYDYFEDIESVLMVV